MSPALDVRMAERRKIQVADRHSSTKSAYCTGCTLAGVIIKPVFGSPVDVKALVFLASGLEWSA